MSVMRKALLAASTNPWLRDHVTNGGSCGGRSRASCPASGSRTRSRRRRQQQKQGITTILTRLGENLTTRRGSSKRSRSTISRCSTRSPRPGSTRRSRSSRRSSGSISIAALCERNMDRLVERAEQREQLRLDRHGGLAVRRSDASSSSSARARRARASGIAIQAYLYRTPKDIESLIPLGPAIRIVKGAYLEPPDVAYPKKSDVDEAFYKLCTRLMAAGRAEGRHAAAHRHARHPARRSAASPTSRSTRCRSRPTSSRCSTASSASSSCGWRKRRPAPARPHQLRRVLVPVVHAPARRASGQRLVRHPDDVRVSCQLPAVQLQPRS